MWDYNHTLEEKRCLENLANVKKIIAKMKNAPNTIRMEEAEKVLKAYGYEFDRQKGSHRHYINNFGDVITIKKESQLKRAYIDDILARIGE